MKTIEEKICDKLQKRINKIWEELEPTIAGTGCASLIEELVDKEIELESYCNM